MVFPFPAEMGICFKLSIVSYSTAVVTERSWLPTMALPAG